MIDDWLQKQLHVQAENIRAKLKNSKLYGKPIDFDNPDMMIVAAYSLASYEWSIRHIDDLELEWSIVK